MYTYNRRYVVFCSVPREKRIRPERVATRANETGRPRPEPIPKVHHRRASRVRRPRGTQHGEPSSTLRGLDSLGLKAPGPARKRRWVAHLCSINAWHYLLIPSQRTGTMLGQCCIVSCWGNARGARQNIALAALHFASWRRKALGSPGETGITFYSQHPESLTNDRQLKKHTQPCIPILWLL